MTDDIIRQYPIDSTSNVSRRTYLRVAAALGGGSVLSSTTAAAASSPQPTAENDREDFLWIPRYTVDAPENQKKYENLLSYAQRYDLSIILSAPDTLPETAEMIKAPLRKAADYGVPCWLATGCFRAEFTAPEFVNDPQARETFLNRLRQITEVYANYYPDGKMIMWHEAPLVSNWDPEGGWTVEAVKNMRDLGPQIFAWQMEAIKDVSADIDAAVFPHFPYVEPGGRFGNIFAQMTDQLKQMNALVDFTFTDFYRGYVEPYDGQEAANAYLRRMMRNVTEETNGRAVYNLGEAHTIGTGYTPSKESMRMNLQAALEGGADGVGWYSRQFYRQTDFDLSPNAFVPNVGGLRDGPNASTLTWARDRFQYAYENTFASHEDFDPSDVFNLWIYGYDMDFYEHRLRLKTADDWEAGDEESDEGWEFVGDFNGYIDRKFEYTGDGTDHVSIFHALDRDRYLGEENTLEAKIETDADSDGSEFYAVYAVPFDANNYLPEPRAPDRLNQSAVAFLQNNQNISDFSLASAKLNTTVSAGETTRVTLSTDEEEEDEED